MKKSYIIITICSVVQVLLLSFLGSYSFPLKAVVTIILYSLETYFLLHHAIDKREKRIFLLLLALPPFVIFIPLHIISFRATLVSLPTTIAYFLGIAGGVFTYHANRPYLKTISIVLIIVLLFFIPTRGYDMWLSKINYGTFTGAIAESITSYSIVDGHGNSFSKDSLRNHLVVLDFWTTSCGMCFQEFPTFQKKIKNYASYKNVKFYTVNIPSKYDSLNHAQKILTERGYGFTNYYMKQKEALNKFKVEYVPTIIILLNGNEVIYRGNIEGVDKYITNYVSKGDK